MSVMFPIYDERAWKRLVKTLDADTAFSVATTSVDDFNPGSTAAYWAAQGTATNAGYPIFIAYDPPKNTLHAMFSYVAS